MVLSKAIYSIQKNRRNFKYMESFSGERKTYRGRIEEFDDNFSRCLHNKLTTQKFFKSFDKQYLQTGLPQNNFSAP
jgi:hypothetical protein